MAFTPYLMFGGTCRAAFTRYHEIFGGDVEILSMADLPEGEAAPEGADDMDDMVMHAALMVDGHLLMASDDPEASGSVERALVSYDIADESEARRIFDALADGGSVGMPLSETFWSPLFGICTDRFGVSWMIGMPGEEPS